MPKRDQILVGLDIGTTKICAIVSEITDDGVLNIIGVGSSPSRGLRKGVVVDIESTVESIKKAVEEAELMAGVEIGSAYVGLAGTHIRGFNSRGVIAVSGRNRVIEREDVHRAIEAAKAVSIPMDREILHVLPQEFVVDDQDGIGDPTGMTGTRLEVNVHIITCSQTAAISSSSRFSAAARATAGDNAVPTPEPAVTAPLRAVGSPVIISIRSVRRPRPSSAWGWH